MTLRINVRAGNCAIDEAWVQQEHILRVISNVVSRWGQVVPGINSGYYVISRVSRTTNNISVKLNMKKEQISQYWHKLVNMLGCQLYVHNKARCSKFDHTLDISIFFILQRFVHTTDFVLANVVEMTQTKTSCDNALSWRLRNLPCFEIVWSRQPAILQQHPAWWCQELRDHQY